ncbi:excalibur calcium-binding domain-containing protein [Paenibacillus alkalitolerans]|uniref:excalibur calcium-binding domain-containing protein n=1 Tax=Paenibacillus alkalitolerans TaxID=2799335 RepID=UPI002D80C110|nr:excalibur calcium-binding domain-containing protein [Paenibacillus alkalitolerans]
MVVGTVSDKVDPATSETETESTSPESTITFASCAEAKAAGKAPLRKGDPGYSTKLDRDGDGIACE